MSNKLKYAALLLSLSVVGASSCYAEDSKMATPAKGPVVLSDSNTVVLNMPIMGPSVSKVILAAQEKDLALPAGQPLYLFIDSPGGSIVDGMEMIQALQGLGREIKTITSFSASMAFITVQSLGERIVTPSGVLMSHHAAGGMDGIIPGSMDTRYHFWNQYIDDVLVPVAKRLGMTVKELHEKDQNEWWTSGSHAVQAKTADAVRLVQCDKSLSGSRVEEFQTFFGPVEVTFAKCPLIKTPLAISFKNIKYQQMSAVEVRDFDKAIQEFFYDKNAFTEDFIVTNKQQNIFK